MAETRVVRETQPGTVPAEPKKKSPARTLILFGILLLVIGAYAHDYFVAAPAAKAAHENIQKLVDERNSQGVKAASLVTSEDIQTTLGKKPSKVDEQKDHTVEIYRYWGGMLPQRQYISVLYLGEKPRRHHVHYLNSMPFEDDYPSETKIPEDAGADTKSGDDKAGGSSTPEGVRTETEAPAPGDAPAPAESGAPADTEKSPAAPATESPEPSSSEKSTDEPAASPETAPESSADKAE